MKIPRALFNIYLLIVVAAVSTGCKTTEEKEQSKQASTLRFHLEVNEDGTARNSGVPIYRERPMLVNVNRDPFLTEGDIDQARVVDVIGGFSIEVSLNKHGALVLDMVSGGNKGRRIGIQSQFGQTRWLAAPMITRRIQDGLFVFTPDASREEAERIVRGLNNLVKKLKKKYTF
jgi:hypothetical protein